MSLTGNKVKISQNIQLYLGGRFCIAVGSFCMAVGIFYMAGGLFCVAGSILYSIGKFFMHTIIWYIRMKILNGRKSVLFHIFIFYMTEGKIVMGGGT